MDIWKKNRISDDLDLVDFEEDIDNILSELEAAVVMLESAIFVQNRWKLMKRKKLTIKKCEKTFAILILDWIVYLIQ